MFTRPAFQNISMQQALWHSIYNYKTYRHESALQIIGLYQQSVQSQGTRNYFTFCEQSYLLITGDNAPNADQRNIRAEWLGITNDTISDCLCINPTQKQYGVLFEYTVDLDQISCLLHNYWFDIQLPVVRVKNNLHACAQNSVILDAFNQPQWCYAQLAPCNQTKTGIEFIKLLLGKTYLACDNYEINAYGGLCIPTSGHQNAQYLFSPFLGFNGHFGFDFGVNFQFNLMRENDCYDVCFFLDLDAVFLISNQQKRTYDLKNKPWSRYLQFVCIDSTPENSIPGVNVLTLESQIHAYDMIEFAAGWRFMTHGVELEVGYRLWGHGTERVHPTCPFTPQFGIAGTGFISGDIPATANLSTISTLAPNDLVFTPITINDIDFNSAQAQRAITHAIQGQIGCITQNIERFEAFIGLGGFYEFTQFNTALNLWGAWIKGGISF